MLRSYLPLEPAARRVGIPKSYLRELAESQQVPFLDVNGRKLFNPAAVLDRLDRMAQGAER